MSVYDGSFEDIYECDSHDSIVLRRVLDRFESGVKRGTISIRYGGGSEVHRLFDDIIDRYFPKNPTTGKVRPHAEAKYLRMDSEAYGEETVGVYIEGQEARDDPYGEMVAWLYDTKTFEVTSFGTVLEEWEEKNYIENPWPKILLDGPDQQDAAVIIDKENEEEIDFDDDDQPVQPGIAVQARSWNMPRKQQSRRDTQIAFYIPYTEEELRRGTVEDWPREHDDTLTFDASDEEFWRRFYLAEEIAAHEQGGWWRAGDGPPDFIFVERGHGYIDTIWPAPFGKEGTPERAMHERVLAYADRIGRGLRSQLRMELPEGPPPPGPAAPWWFARRVVASARGRSGGGYPWHRGGGKTGPPPYTTASELRRRTLRHGVIERGVDRVLGRPQRPLPSDPNVTIPRPTDLVYFGRGAGGEATFFWVGKDLAGTVAAFTLTADQIRLLQGREKLREFMFSRRATLWRAPSRGADPSSWRLIMPDSGTAFAGLRRARVRAGGRR